LALDVPYLGICYGMGVLASAAGGVTTRGSHREYGRADLVVHDDSDLFRRASRAPMRRRCG
jgi:GMP synthase (glutamine-hydrolysing)